MSTDSGLKKKKRKREKRKEINSNKLLIDLCTPLSSFLHKLTTLPILPARFRPPDNFICIKNAEPITEGDIYILYEKIVVGQIGDCLKCMDRYGLVRAHVGRAHAQTHIIFLQFVNEKLINTNKCFLFIKRNIPAPIF